MEPKVLNRKVIFESRKFRVIEKEMEFSSGERGAWEVIESRDRAASRVLALLDTNELIFIKEWRGAVERYVMRFPTGLLEENETPDQAAQRELREETGFSAERLFPLGTLEPVGGYFKGVPIHIFFATGLHAGNPDREVGEQGMEVFFIPLEKAYQMVEDAEFEDPETIYALLLLKKHLK